MKKQEIISVILINLIIAGAFWIYHRPSGYTALSGDNNNIIPICHKKDNPALFQDDLYLNDLENVRYYTPFYVETLRGIKHLFRIDYLEALKILFFLTHLIYGITWFLLFYKVYGNFWIALMLSLLIRGIVWLPGMEMWGISDLWTMMPRTVYGALMPIPFLLIKPGNTLRWYISGFLVGLVLNFHPITGLGGILIYMVLATYFLLIRERQWKIYFFTLLAILAGMFPFVFNYFMHTPSGQIDQELFTKALFTRIPEYFSDPILFVQKTWLSRPARYFFFFFPVLLLGLISLRYKKYRVPVYLILVSIFLLVLLPNLSVYVEKGVNAAFDSHLRMSFQLLRIQKLAVLAGYFAWGYILLFITEYFKYGYLWVRTIAWIFLVLIVLSKWSLFNGIPIIGDDIVRTILPNNLSVGKVKDTRGNPELEKMLDYIRKNTDENAVFTGYHIIRASTQRSVKCDTKGASMIIEGNPVQFVQWYKNKKALDTLDLLSKMKFYKNQRVDYWLTRDTLPMEPIFQSGKWKLYKLPLYE